MQDCESNGLDLTIEKNRFPTSCLLLDDPLCDNSIVDTKNNFLESAYEEIFEDLLEDAIWEVSFDVHRAVKLGSINLEDSKEIHSQIFNPKAFSKDIHGQDDASFEVIGNYPISCPICQKRACATKFARHLARCIGIGDRNSSRTASQKLIALQEDYDDEFDFDDDSDSSYKSRKRRKNTKKKKTKKKPKGRKGNSASDPFVNYRDMTYEQIESFFNQMCGVVCKRTDRLCKKSLNCSQHTDEMRKDVRHNLLRHMGEQLANDGQIDVDTVDEGNGELPFFIQALPTSTPPEHISCLSNFHEAQPSSSSNNGLQEEVN